MFYSTVFLLIAEFTVAVAGPLLVPKHLYLRLYLGGSEGETAARFLADRYQFYMYDRVLGWRNRPDAAQANWRIDSLGSRSTHAVRLERSTPRRVLFLGSSLINGWLVSATETISAQVEDSTTEAVNFGTNLYSLDQMYLAYSSELYRYDANVIVVGLPAEPGDGLTNRYVPFRVRNANMPFLKPRFEMTDTGVALMPVPPKDVYAQMFRTDGILDSLRTTDTYYSQFSQFAHFGLTPIASGIWSLCEHARNLVRLIAGDESTLPLAMALMQRLEVEAGNHGALVVFILLPYQKLTYPPAWRRRLPDHYGRTVEELRKRGFLLVDGRQVLRQAAQAPWRVYASDAVHYTPKGNRLLGEALKKLLSSSAMPRGRQPRPQS